MEENRDYKQLWLTSRQVINIQSKMVQLSSLLCEQLSEINENYLKELKQLQTDIIIIGDINKEHMETISAYKKILSDNGWEV